MLTRQRCNIPLEPMTAGPVDPSAETVRLTAPPPRSMPSRSPITTAAVVDQLLAHVEELAAGGFLTPAQLSEVRTAITRAAEKRGIYPQPTGRDGLPH